MIFNQQEFEIRLEWGIRGVEELAPISDVVIIVDVLSFSTSVDIATNNGALIFPYKSRDETASSYADTIGALVATSRRSLSDGFSLSPQSLVDIKAGAKLVLPSPNGSTLTLATGKTPTICGCFRNAKAVAEYAMQVGHKIAVIPAGERWEDNSLRVAYEDLLGAGCIISFLKGSMSPESKSALVAYSAFQNTLLTEVKACNSGKELIEMGFETDIDLACQVNCSNNIPLLQNGYYIGKRGCQ